MFYIKLIENVYKRPQIKILFEFELVMLNQILYDIFSDLYEDICILPS